jgi:hypothetical protein
MARPERPKVKSYSIQKHHGNWVMRWSVYKDGKRTQPTFVVASIEIDSCWLVKYIISDALH